MRPRPSRPAVRWWVLVLPALTLVGFAICVVLDLRPAGGRLAVQIAPEHGWGYAANGMLEAALASIVLLRDVRQRFGWALAWLGLFWMLDGLAQSYVRMGLGDQHALPAMTLALWFLQRLAAFLPISVAVLLLIYPTGRFLAGAWGAAGRVALGLMCTAAAFFVVTPSSALTSAPAAVPGVDFDPTTWWALAPVATSLRSVLLTVALTAFVVPVLTVVVRFRRSVGVDRDRMRWLLWGVIAMVLVVAVTSILDIGRVEVLSTFLVIALPSVATTVAIVNPAVVPIEDLLGRTLVYGGLSLMLVVVDLAVLAGLTRVLGDRLDQRQVVLVVLLLTALLYGPLRTRLAGGVRRLVLGDRTAPYDVVAGLASTLESADEGTDQLAAVADTVASAFRVGFVSVEVDRSDGERLTVTHGTRPAETRTLPITYRDTEVGRLVLPVHGLRSRLSRRDEQLLGDLVRQAATAARTHRLADDLQVSRERLVVAREEERRRIRRDLHDGLGPSLGGVVFALESARLMVQTDPEAAAQQLAGTTGHLQEVVADVRRLVHDLRPPALDDRGLVGALRQQAERLTGSGTRTRVESGPLDELPAAVEVAAFRIAGEAMNNVGRHARATECVVRLERDAGHLVVEVRDDGVGIGAVTEAGVGLLSLRERASELGGRSDVSCPPEGGTLVRAWLPLRRTE